LPDPAFCRGARRGFKGLPVLPSAESVARLEMVSEGLGESDVASVLQREIISSPVSAQAHSHEHHEFNSVSDSRDFWDV
jgi:hypothetical protein